MRWFKMHSDIVDDAKMAELSDRNFRIWVYLLAIYCENSSDDGLEINFKNIAWRLRLSETVVRRAIEVFVSMKMVEVSEKIIIINWRKRQFCESKERTRRYRERHGDGHGDVTVTHGGDASVTPSEQNRSEKIRKEYINPELKFPREGNSSPGHTPAEQDRQEQGQDSTPSQDQEQDKPGKRGRKLNPKPEDGRPEACDPEQWEKYLAYSRTFHEERAATLGAIAPFSEAKVTAGAKALDNLVRVKGLDKAQLGTALEWAVLDDFWGMQVRSLAPLTGKGRNGETKAANMMASWATSVINRNANGGDHARQ